MSDFSDNAISPEFRFLLERFHVVDSSNGYMELVGGNLRISFQRDRYYEDVPIIIQVASAHDEPKEGTRYVYGLESIRALVLKSEPSGYTPISELADFLRTHMTTVQSMFSCRYLAATRAVLHRQGVEWMRIRSGGSAVLPSAPPNYDAFGESFFARAPSPLRCYVRQLWRRFIALFG